MKSDEDKMIDDLLREKLGGYKEQPRTELWQGIVQKLPYKPFGKYFPGSDSGILLTLIGGLIVTAGLVYFIAGNKDSRASKEKQSSQLVIPQLQKSVLKTEKEALAPSTSELSTDQKTIGYSSAAINLKNSVPLEKSPKNKIRLTQQYPPIILPGGQRETITTIEELPLASLVAINPKPVLLLADINNTYYIQSLRKDNYNYSFLPNSSTKSPYFKIAGNYMLTAYYRPEYLKGKIEEAFASTRYATGLALRYSRNNIVIESGLEYNSESRNQNYNVQSFDFLGTYQNLDSIAFAFQGGQLVPNYYYSTDSVFSSALSTKKFSHKSTYSFLKIPVLIGMEKQLGAFTIGVKGGLLFGILLNQSGNGFQNLTPESHIYSYESASPSYVSTNVQWMLKADIDWNIKPNFGVNLAPTINEYLSDPYDKTKITVGSPVYWGVQAGIFYKW